MIEHTAGRKRVATAASGWPGIISTVNGFFEIASGASSHWRT
jgi:hypothetical protein